MKGRPAFIVFVQDVRVPCVQQVFHNVHVPITTSEREAVVVLFLVHPLLRPPADLCVPGVVDLLVRLLLVEKKGSDNF